MAREVSDSESTVWTCIQAYAGLHDDGINRDAARDDATGRVTVVCTPSGGARSVRLELDPAWENSLDDDVLLELIDEGLRGAAKDAH